MATTATTYVPWSVDEQRVIHQHYRALGAAGCLPLLPGRTRCGIRNEAQQLGLRYDYKAAARRRTETAHETGARPEPTWRAPQPRFASVWHYAAGASA